MISTVTAAPSRDITYLPAHASEGRNARRGQTYVEVGEKGVNISRALTVAIIPTTTVFPPEGHIDEHLHAVLSEDAVPHHAVLSASTTRVNTNLLNTSSVREVNAPESSLPPGEQDLGSGDWPALSGRLPEKACTPVPILAWPTRENDAQLAIDSSGPARSEALKTKLDLLARNLIELTEICPATAGNKGVPFDPRRVAAVVPGPALHHGAQLLRRPESP